MGGNGADAADNSGTNGGAGGAGVKGAFTVEVLTGGSITGGNGGHGANVTDASDTTTALGTGGSGGKGADVRPEAANNGGTITDGTNGLDGVRGAAPVVPPEEKKHTVTFTDDQGQNIAGGSSEVAAGGSIDETVFDKMVQWAQQKAQELNKTFLAWVDGANKVYTKFTQILTDVILKPLFHDGNSVSGADGRTIAAKDFTVGKADLQALQEETLKTLADVKAYGPAGEITEIAVAGLDDLKTKTDTKTYKDLISFSIGDGENQLTVKVDVTITDEAVKFPVTIIGRTAHT